MAVNEVVIRDGESEQVLIDLTNDTVLPEMVMIEQTFTGADGNKAKGTLPRLDFSNIKNAMLEFPVENFYDGTDTPMTQEQTDSYLTARSPTPVDSNLLLDSNGNKYLEFGVDLSELTDIEGVGSGFSKHAYMAMNNGFEFTLPLSNFGDATADDVLAGKTFTSNEGIKVEGTYTPPEPTDFSQSTVTEETLLAGTKAYNSNGTLITGTYTPPVVPTFSTIYTGTGTPSNSIGADGDLFFNF